MFFGRFGPGNHSGPAVTRPALPSTSRSSLHRDKRLRHDGAKDEDVAGLLLMLGLLGFVFAAALFWCLLSSCMGTSILEGFSNLWEYVRLGSQYGRIGGDTQGKNVSRGR
ncbi:hypothetical protein FA13DRAFT_1196758 [Coprinellus micaceus]|uniref:Uncharacterized protein n=1 Tax=Coprinellus micaceus TaxID=71717 RepID=A0A4Y7R8S5_COPMI|nr:hypothetical protein FA13DRAFT_1196758 [Coprinellus micaceus]